MCVLSFCFFLFYVRIGSAEQIANIFIRTPIAQDAEHTKGDIAPPEFDTTQVRTFDLAAVCKLAAR